MPHPPARPGPALDVSPFGRRLREQRTGRWTAPLRRALLVAAAVLSLAGASAAGAWELQGTRTVYLQTRDGALLRLGSVELMPDADGSARFRLHIDTEGLRDHFLSMKEFKCLEGPELMCHVPYPYAQPGRVRAGQWAWLEHSLLFLYKQPRDFGAKLWNGLYFRLEADAEGLVGTPQAIDLNLISAPPDDLTTPPYSPALRDDVAPGTRWISRLLIR